VPSNLLAGVQLAMTQPIRIDDVVIVESEWDTIAEIAAIRNSGTPMWPP
jgi:small-conductance mechanosensitive channel